jgi:CRP-like cAMP-binding protein
MQQLIDYIEQFVKLDSDAVNALENTAIREIYKKNQPILEQGQRCNKIWFLKKGMVRKYHIYDGKEITSWIHTPNDMITSLPAYVQGIPSEEYLQAYEETELISISKSGSEKLSQYPQFITFINALMEREFAKIDKHTKALNSKDAKGKYEYLREIAPELIKKSKLGHIASIIGVTQETLSRIRKT